MPPEISNLADSLLNNPVKVAVTPVSSTVDAIKQSLYFVEHENKKNLLIHILKDSSIISALIFTRTKHGANKVAENLVKAGINADAIHGNKSHNARQRALNNFKTNRTRVLVATDIAARGIDIDELSHVINYDLPEIPENYVHRIGRTGRAGLTGSAISFCGNDEKYFLKEIKKLITYNIPVIDEHPYKMENPPTLSDIECAKKNPVSRKNSHNISPRNKIKSREQIHTTKNIFPDKTTKIPKITKEISLKKNDPVKITIKKNIPGNPKSKKRFSSKSKSFYN
jgi:ATP-dependent RNA helicase RhlE